jgi:hypothetical protein
MRQGLNVSYQSNLYKLSHPNIRINTHTPMYLLLPKTEKHAD